MIELRTRFLSLLFVVAALPATACGDDDTAPAMVGAAQQGESCRAHYDCAPGLACVGKVCGVGSFPIEPIVSRECVRVECRTALDCCPLPSATCTTYKQYCDAGDTYYCTLYQSECVCTDADWSCEKDLCVQRCTTTTDCSLGGESCVNSRCVECAADDECGTDEVCKDQRCVPKCTSSDECPYFHDCREGTCVEVGCKTDRECQAAMGNVLSACLENECKTPCLTDVECDAPRDYGHSRCVDGYCIDVGCDSDDECRILLDVQAGRGADAVCRDKNAP